MTFALTPAHAALTGVALVAVACWWVAGDRAERDPSTRGPSEPVATFVDPPAIGARLHLRLDPGASGIRETKTVVADLDPSDPENRVTHGDVALRVWSDSPGLGLARIVAHVACAELGESLVFDVPGGASDSTTLAVSILDDIVPLTFGVRLDPTRFESLEGTLTLNATRFRPGERIPVGLELRYTVLRDARISFGDGNSWSPQPRRVMRVRFAGIVEVEPPSK